MLPAKKEELLSFLQRHLNSKVIRGQELPDRCVWVTEVELVQDWVESPRVVAIVRSADDTQSVLFLCIGSQISPGVYLDLSISELIALDEAFQCEVEPSRTTNETPLTLRITGRRLTKARPGRIHRTARLRAARPQPIYESHGDASSDCHPDSEATTTENNGDSVIQRTQFDEPEESNCSVQLPECGDAVKDGVAAEDVATIGSSQYDARPPIDSSSFCYRLCHFILRFTNAGEMALFREETSKHMTSCQTVARSYIAVRVPRQFEIGVDALNATNSMPPECWLDKYRPEISRNRGGRSAIRHGKPPGVRTCVNGSTRPDFQCTEYASDSLTGSSSDSSISDREPSPRPTLRHMISVTDSATTNKSDKSTALARAPAASTRLYSSTASLDDHSPEHDASSPEIQTSNSNRSGHSLSSSTTGTTTTTDAHPTPVKVIASSQSCSDLLSGTPTFGPQPRRRSKNFLEDHLYRARLSQSEWLIRQELLKRADEYCTFETVRIFVGTWNVNGRNDANLNLDDWLLPPDDQPPADIYVFGFQELDLSIGSVALNKTSPAALEDRWTAQLESALGGLLRSLPSKVSAENSGADKPQSYAFKWRKQTGGGYIRLKRARLAGILMIVYISIRMFSHANASELAIQLVPTGVFNMMGNKGAVGLRLTLYNTAICFVNCHLAAGEANLERRNQDFQEVKRKMVFERRTNSANPNAVDQLTMQSHDIVFVFGDLNYRISGMDSAAVRGLVDRKEYDRILTFDELGKQRLTSRTFGGFCESKITFAPTFKFDMNSNVYDTSEKNRVPSYCDRILWSGKHCEAVVYRSHHEFTMSDHKPVSGYYKIGARRVNRTLFQRAYEAVVRSQDLVYNLSLPQAQLENQELDFGPVRFHEICQKTLTLTNTGLRDLQYQFMREGIADFPAWLTVTPESMSVEKGASIQINVEIFVTPELVASLNSGNTSISTIVVLRLIGGKDYFVSISGQFIPTCFGLPLNLLLTLGTVPVAWLPVSDLQAKIKAAAACMTDDRDSTKTETASPSPHPFRIPKELFRLVDFISLHINEPELFRQSGKYDDVRVIRDMLDTTTSNVSFPDTVSVHSVAFCLLIFLNTLTEAVIPEKFQAQCLQAADNHSAAVKALARIPLDHQNLFYYLTAFLRSCLALSEKNGTDVALLASSFGDVVFRDTLASRKATRSFIQPASRLEDTSMFMRHFLTENPSTMFSGLLL